jgi:DNA-binding MarR family transcriptional regulator
MKHYTKDTFQMDESVGYLLNKARNLVLMEMDAALKDLEITGQQMGILISLTRGLAATPFELSKRLGIDTGLMTRMLDKLETRGLLVRSRSVEDRRVVNLTLTDKGRVVSAQLPSIAPEVLNARLETFTTAEFDELRRLLRKLLGEPA